MAVKVETTKIKQSTYLLVPKDIADMIEINKNTKFSLKVKQNGKNRVLEYRIQ